jgi:DNA polymerase-3 subunit alpha
MFVHLHCHSHYSFLRAVPSPAELVAAAVGQKMPAVALTDTGGLYAAVPFYLAAREAGVKPIVGVVLEIATENPCGEIPRPTFGGARDDKEKTAAERRNETLVLLAADRTGYSNLCRLVTARQLEERPVSLKALHAHRAGLLALAAPTDASQHNIRRGTALVPSPPLVLSPAEGRAEGCRAPTEDFERVAQLKEIFGDALYLKVRHLSAGDARALRAAAQIGREFGVPLVATNNVHFIRPEEHLHHRVLNAIRTGSLLTTVARPEIAGAEAWFKPAEEMCRAFPNHPEALRATLEIAERANLELELGKLIFPSSPCPKARRRFPICGSCALKAPGSAIGRCGRKYCPGRRTNSK